MTALFPSLKSPLHWSPFLLPFFLAIPLLQVWLLLRFNFFVSADVWFATSLDLSALPALGSLLIKILNANFLWHFFNEVGS